MQLSLWFANESHFHIAKEELCRWKFSFFFFYFLNLGFFYTAWCSEIGSLTSLDAWNSGAFIDVKEPISPHQAALSGWPRNDTKKRLKSLWRPRKKTWYGVHFSTFFFFRLYEAFQIKFLARISFFVVRLSFVAARAERIIELNWIEDKARFSTRNSARHLELVTHNGGTLFNFLQIVSRKAIFWEVAIQQEEWVVLCILIYFGWEQSSRWRGEWQNVGAKNLDGENIKETGIWIRRERSEKMTKQKMGDNIKLWR